MSGLLESVVRRGAGLPAPTGQQVLTLRPLSRFERPWADAGEGRSGATPALEGAGEPQVRTGPHVSGPRQETPASTEPAVEHGRDEFNEVHDLMPPARRDSRVARAADRVPSIDRPNPIVHDAATPATDVVVASPVAPESTSTATEAPVAPPRTFPSPPPAVGAELLPGHPAESRIETMPIRVAAAPAAPEFHPDRPEPARGVPPQALGDPRDLEPTSQPSISIGRIDIMFASPPVVPSRAPRESTRTRGFAAYVRARRGFLR
jgi:hypothetical protein